VVEKIIVRSYILLVMSPLELIGLIASVIAIYEFSYKLAAYLFKKNLNMRHYVASAFKKIFLDGAFGSICSCDTLFKKT
jgi:hypothetical protein